VTVTWGMPELSPCFLASLDKLTTWHHLILFVKVDNRGVFLLS
jgi:hypothetical protein